MLEGRPVHGDDEVVLGTGTASELDVGVGDEVTVGGDDERHRLKVVGLAALPVLDDRSGVDIGAIMSPRRLRSVAPDDSLNRDVLVRWAPGVDAAAARRRLERTSESEVFGARLPSELANLERVRALPWALAALLAVVALLAIVHAVFSTVRAPAAGPRRAAHARSRRSPVVGARALGGFDLRRDRLVFGIPLGLVAGRVVWHQVATGIGVGATATTPAAGAAADRRRRVRRRARDGGGAGVSRRGMCTRRRRWR